MLKLSRISLQSWIQCLPFAFTLHNIEELFGMEKWSKTVPNYIHPPVTTDQFLIAITLFSILGFTVVFAPPIRQSNYYYHVIAGFSGMLLLNVFLPHLIATIIFKGYAPGVITGLVINLPLTATILLTLALEKKLTRYQLLIMIMLGGFVGISLAFLFLRIGHLIN